jgi:hypothetical protein
MEGLAAARLSFMYGQTRKRRKDHAIARPMPAMRIDGRRIELELPVDCDATASSVYQNGKDRYVEGYIGSWGRRYTATRDESL